MPVLVKDELGYSEVAIVEREGLVTDSLTWGVAASYAVSETIKFLYAQTGEILNSIREGKNKPQEAVKATPPAGLFPHAPDELEFDAVKASEAEQQIEEAFSRISKVQQVAAGTALDHEQAESVEHARRLLEALSGANLSLRDEPERWPSLEVNLNIDTVHETGEVSILEAARVPSTHDTVVRGTIKDVKGKVTGTKLG